MNPRNLWTLAIVGIGLVAPGLFMSVSSARMATVRPQEALAPSLSPHDALPAPGDPDAAVMSVYPENTLWLDEVPGRVVAILPASEGWLLACNDTLPRQYQFGRVARIGANGKTLWRKEFIRSDLEIKGVVALGDGSWIIAGTDSPTWSSREISRRDLSGLEDESGRPLAFASRSATSRPWVVRVSDGGEILWERHLETPADEFVGAVMHEPDTGVVMASTRFTESNDKRWVLTALTLDGEPLWQSIFAMPDDRLCEAALRARDGGWWIAGTINPVSSDHARMAVIRVNAEREIVWDHGGQGASAATLTGLTELPGNAVVLAGRLLQEEGARGILRMIDAAGHAIREEIDAQGGWRDILRFNDQVVAITDRSLSLREPLSERVRHHVLRTGVSLELLKVVPSPAGPIWLLGAGQAPEDAGGEARLVLVRPAFAPPAL